MTNTTPRLPHTLGLLAAVGIVALCLALSPSLWVLLVIPIVLSVPVAGWSGLVAVLSASTAVAIGATLWGGASVLQVGVGICAFAAAAMLVGARYLKVARTLERISGASLRDRLTGLYNFAYFSDALAREHSRTLRYGGSLSLILLDIDRFKSFNDTHGHAAGNELLAATGRILAAERRTTDIVARFGGEEFAVLVPGSSEMAAEVADRIRRAVSRLDVEVGGGRRDGRTISAGVASLRPDDTPEDLVERADRALYLSKERGRNRVSIASEGSRPVVTRRAAG